MKCAPAMCLYKKISYVRNRSGCMLCNVCTFFEEPYRLTAGSHREVFQSLFASHNKNFVPRPSLLFEVLNHSQPGNQPTHPPTNRTANQPTQTTDQPTNQPKLSTSQPTNLNYRPANQPTKTTDQPTNQPIKTIDQPTNQPKLPTSQPTD